MCDIFRWCHRLSFSSLLRSQKSIYAFIFFIFSSAASHFLFIEKKPWKPKNKTKSQKKFLFFYFQWKDAKKYVKHEQWKKTNKIGGGGESLLPFYEYFSIIFCHIFLSMLNRSKTFALLTIHIKPLTKYSWIDNPILNKTRSNIRIQSKKIK